MGRSHGILLLIEEKYARPVVDYFGARNWRVTVPGFHIHTSAAMYGTFCADGTTVGSAGMNLLANARKGRVAPGENCGESCPHFTPSI